MDLSVVTTLYRSAPYLREFHARIQAEAEQLADSFEIILVNDDSPDTSRDIALELCAEDDHVLFVDLTKNTGHQIAVMIGIGHTTGEKIVVMDCDLEDQPEWLHLLLAEQRRTNADVVYCVPQSEDKPLPYRLGARLFYALHGWLYPYPGPRNQTMTRLISKRFAAKLVQREQAPLLMDCLCSALPHKQSSIVVERRHKGSTTYGICRKASLFADLLLCTNRRIFRVLLFPYKLLFWRNFVPFSRMIRSVHANQNTSIREKPLRRGGKRTLPHTH